MKGFLKPTKEKGILFTIIFAANMLLSPEFTSLVFRFLHFTEPAPIINLMPIILFNLPVISVVMVMFHGLVHPLVSLLLLVYWWLIACLFSPPFFNRLGFREVARIFIILFLIAYALNLAFVFSIYG